MMSSMNRVCLVIVGVLLLPAAPARAQEAANLRGDSGQTRKRLVEAEQKLLSGKSAEALDDLLRVLDEAGDDFISLDGKHYQSARWVVHGLLVRLPAEALKSYQDRIDDPARTLVAAAKRSNDPAPLWQLLDRFFVSRPSEEGLAMLGDILFERGEFLAAEKQWRRLLPDADADIVYPGAKGDLALIRARLVIAAIFENDIERAKRELAAFKAKHATAVGEIAGKNGRLVETLEALLTHPHRLPLPANPGADWPTYGGSPSRSGRSTARLGGEWPPSPTWKEALNAIGRRDDAPATAPRRPPFSHPVIAGGQVFVTDGYRVFAFNLLTGQPSIPLRLATPPEEQRTDKPPPDPCPSLSAFGDLIYVRVGSGLIHAANGPKRVETSIVCIRAIPNPGGTCAFKERWRITPPAAEDHTPTCWEGTPTIAGRRLWAAYSRFDGGRIIQGIACYDPCDSSMAPDRPAWAAEVCDGAILDSVGRARHELLTVTDRHVVYCTNNGLVVALDALSGRRAWAFRYARARHPDPDRSPHPHPAVFSAGHIFIAPADSDHVYALDAETGTPRWSSGTMTGANLLGISAGRLVVTADAPDGGIRALSLADGSYRGPKGWIQSDPGGVTTFGQGFVTDDLIVWPTRAGLYFLRSEHGRPVGDPRASPMPDFDSDYFGNVVYADGVLVVVSPTQIWGYVSQERRFGSVQSLSSRSSPQTQLDWMIERTERALAAGDPAAARAELQRAAISIPDSASRAWAIARFLLLLPRPIDESILPTEVRAGLTPELRNEWLFNSDGMPITLGDLLAQRSRSATGPPVAPALGPDRYEGCELPPGAEIVRTLRLAPGTAPLLDIAGSSLPHRNLYARSDTELVAISIKDAALARHAATDSFSHVAELPEGFVAVGPSALALYGTERMPSWVFRVPTTPPLPAHPGQPHVFFGSAPPRPDLSSFRIAGSILFARLGNRHLIAFDLAGRRVLWVLGTHGKPGFIPESLPGNPQFGPEFGVTGQFLAVQVSGGRRWFVRCESGTILPNCGLGKETATVWWRCGPVEREPNLLAVPDGPGLVRLLDLAHSSVRWSHHSDGEAGLTGEPPQILSRGNLLLVAVRRSYGIELDRLDPTDGASLWSEGPAFLDADRVDLGHADADAKRVFVCAADKLVALSLKSGQCDWQGDLPQDCVAGPWIAHVGRNCIIAYPKLAVPREPVGKHLVRMARSFAREPSWGRLPALAIGAYDAWVARSFPVLFFDPDTGKRLVRFDIPAAGPVVNAVFERDVAVVATGDRVVWLR